MVLALNLAILVVLASCLALAYYLKKLWPLVTGAVIVFLYTFVQPSYMPKGIIERNALPDFEIKDFPLQDRNLAPVPGAERDAAREQKIRDGMEWYQKQKEEAKQ